MSYLRNVSPFVLLLLLASCSGDSYSLLMQASRFGDVQGIGKYIAEGFDVNDKTKQGKTPLILAAAEGHAKAIEALLDAGANIHAQDNNGATALMVAATAGHAEAVRVLLARGANIAAKDHDGGTPILNAVFFGYRDAAAELLKRKDAIDPADLNEVVLIAAGMGHTDILKDMVQNNLNMNIVGLHNRTPAMAAIKFGRAETLRVLLENKVDLAAKDSDGHTALDIALESGNTKIIDMVSAALETPAAPETPAPAAPATSPPLP